MEGAATVEQAHATRSWPSSKKRTSRVDVRQPQKAERSREDAQEQAGHEGELTPPGTRYCPATPRLHVATPHKHAESVYELTGASRARWEVRCALRRCAD